MKFQHFTRQTMDHRGVSAAQQSTVAKVEFKGNDE